jgi:Flp pilus assembly pilin Flp
MRPIVLALASLASRLNNQDGQTMAEYGILLGVIALVVLVAAVLMGGSISSILHDTSSHL